MRPGTRLTLRGSTGFAWLMILCILGLVSTAPLPDESNESDDYVDDYNYDDDYLEFSYDTETASTETENFTPEDCPEFDFETEIGGTKNCDFYQRVCEGDDPKWPPYLELGTISWRSKLTTKGKSGNKTGILMIQPGKNVAEVQIFLGLKNPKDWAFGISNTKDKSEIPDPANGFSAEIHNCNKELIIYEEVRFRDIIGPPIPSDFMADYFEDDPVRFDVRISKHNVKLKTTPSVKGTDFQLKDNQMFTFDEGFAVGINQDPANSEGIWSKSGSGVYAICVRMIPKPKEKNHFFSFK